MSAEFAEKRVREIIADQLGVGEEEISLDASISQDLGADRLDFLELMLALEEEFEVDIDDEEAEKFEKVSDIVEFLSHRTQ